MLKKENDPKKLNCLKKFHGPTQVSSAMFILRIKIGMYKNKLKQNSGIIHVTKKGRTGCVFLLH